MGTREEQWLENYSELKQFYKKHGHSSVPSHSKEFPKLGRWVSKLRMREDKLTEKQKSLLKKIDFNWSSDVENRRYEQFMVRYRELLGFKRKFGHANVPSKIDDEKYKKLGRWVEVLRASERNDKLEDWKKDMLSEAGINWSSELTEKADKEWTRMYGKLADFHKKFGHSNVPENWEKDIELSKWVVGQRRRKKPLTGMRKKLLVDLDFRWNNEPLERVRDGFGRYKPLNSKD